jgi:hypothetical protein
MYVSYCQSDFILALEYEVKAVAEEYNVPLSDQEFIEIQKTNVLSVASKYCPLSILNLHDMRL